MPTTIWLPREATAPQSGHSGVAITWTKTARRIDISGWYDSYVGIQGDAMSLREFFDALGITEKDCKRAWKD